MKTLHTLLLLLLCAASYAQIVGGAGVCHVTGDPNGELPTIDDRYECSVAKDIATGDLYVYDPSRAAGDKWVLLNGQGEATTVTDGATIDLTLTGTDITAEAIISPDADNIIEARANGLYATSAGATDDQNLTGGTLTGETLDVGIEDGTGLSIDLSTFATDADLAASDAADLDKDPANEIQTLTTSYQTATNFVTVALSGSNNYAIGGGEGIKVDNSIHGVTIINTAVCKGIYPNIAAAIGAGLVVGDCFQASQDNTMGANPGSDITIINP